MRISQLARSLGIPPSDIVEFLGNENVDANSRLEKEVVEKVMNHFAPGKTRAFEEPEVEETPPPQVSEKQPEEETPLEVIRVSKVELQGLKVLGKIDLPAPKKKAEPTPEQQQEQQNNQPSRRENQREFQKRNNRRDRDWANPLEAKRQQEARDAEKRKRESAEKQKEKRTNHYYSKVKSVPTKAARRFEEQTVVEDVAAKEPPKGIFGRFLRWLRT
ncbi:MAG TPA: translation initiation factor IF-2 N-terminal domain-containing protein [Cyclobacteriaceae bacterium]